MDSEESMTTENHGLKRCVYPHCTVTLPNHCYGLHLNYCRRKWNGHVVTCPYNPMHRYGEPEDVFHRQTCPDKPHTDGNNLIVEMFKGKANLSDAVQEKENRSSNFKPSKIATLRSVADLFGNEIRSTETPPDGGDTDGGSRTVPEV